MKKFTLFVACMTVLMLAACAQPTPSSSIVSSEPIPSATSTAETAVATAVATKEAPVEISALVTLHTMTKELTELPQFQQFEKEANVKIKWEYVRTGWDDRKNLILSSGDLPEVFLSGLTANDIVGNLTLFMPLDNLITQYAPNITHMFTDSPTLKITSVMPDGKLYSLPTRMPNRPEYVGPAFINKTWLDKIGRPMPTTIDEFTQVLEDFVTKDPNGNNQQDEFGLSAQGFLGGSFTLTCLTGMFDCMTSGDSKFGVDNGKVYYAPATEGFHQYAKWLAKLNKEKILDLESLISGNWSVRVSEPIARLGVTMAWSLDAMNAEYKDQYVPLMPMKGPNGSQYWPSNPEMRASSLHKVVFSAKNAHPDAAMRWINFFYDQGNGVQIYYGPIDVSVTENASGVFTVLDPPAGQDNYDSWQWMNGLGDGSPIYVSAPFEKSNIILSDGVTHKKVQAISDAYKPYFKASAVLPRMVLQPEDSMQVSSINTDIDRLVTEKLTQWVQNDGIDAEWDSYITSMNTMGLEKELDIYQRAYNDYLIKIKQ